MKINQEEAKQYLEKIVPIIQAVAEGKTIQYRGVNEWVDYEWNGSLELDHPTAERRIKPEPKLRPWKPEEVPVGACVKWGAISMIVSTTTDGILVAGYKSLVEVTFHDCLRSVKWKWPQEPDTDWKQCGVSE